MDPRRVDVSQYTDTHSEISSPEADQMCAARALQKSLARISFHASQLAVELRDDGLSKHRDFKTGLYRGSVRIGLVVYLFGARRYPRHDKFHLEFEFSDFCFG
jgi:hypothetical protein